MEDMLISQPPLIKSTLHEPVARMVPPSTTNASSKMPASSSGRRGRSPSATSSSTHTTKPSADLDPADAAALQNAVEVSIARQISISRQQRNLLRPLNTARPAVPNVRAVGPLMGGRRSPLGVLNGKSPSPNRLSKDEPIKDTKSSTPTLVHRRGSPVDPQNRKSSWVVIDND